MKIRATKKQCVTKSGDIWEWEETEETRKALKKLHSHSTQDDNVQRT